MPLEITIDSPDKLDDALEGLSGLLEAAFESFDATAALTAGISDLEAQEEDVFQNEKSPAGEAWQPNAPLTIANKGHDVILHETGRLGASLFGATGDSIRDVSEAGLTFGTSVEYGVFNQEGTARAPARPFLGWGDDALDKVTNRVADALQKHVTEALP